MSPLSYVIQCCNAIAESGYQETLDEGTCVGSSSSALQTYNPESIDVFPLKYITKICSHKDPQRDVDNPRRPNRFLTSITSPQKLFT
ncbi:hypothetical protein Smp_153940 [Schistosoma mansoni]|uniref:hypothetical protein n=1 Tax=Schistosoma mansoni TaxID=6183 RepID=UPI0001A640E8|nr:hypothetical protein Smp_153940 [Schistosoma mansoni]|eukprot:XP_018652047.1 hypothetical protein Smp_153940 [Schistosoma mansoni]